MATVTHRQKSVLHRGPGSSWRGWSGQHFVPGNLGAGCRPGEARIAVLAQPGSKMSHQQAQKT